MNEKLRIAVLFGGKSPEHEVSVITGLQVLKNIDTTKFDAMPIYVSKEGNWYTSSALEEPKTYRSLTQAIEKSHRVELLPVPKSSIKIESFAFFARQKSLEIDILFPCFHGGLGENGGFQGLFELIEIPYIGSGILDSAIGMDKILTRQLLRANDIPQVSFYWFYRNLWEKSNIKIIKDIESKFSYPVFVKPSNGGSSIGVTKAKNKTELVNGIEVACAYDRKVIVEQGVGGAREINISVMGNSGSNLQFSACEEVLSDKELLDFDQKYVNAGGKSFGMVSAKRELPAKLQKATYVKIKNTAKKVFEALDCTGLIRVDFLVKEDSKELFVIEVNSIPGSMSFYLWEANDLKFKDMITKLIKLAVEKSKDRQKNTEIFESNILESVGSSLKAPKL